MKYKKKSKIIVFKQLEDENSKIVSYIMSEQNRNYGFKN